MNGRGHFGIGAYRLKFETNFGTLIRSAATMGADYVFTINKRCPGQKSSVGHENHIPTFHFDTAEEFVEHSPDDAMIVGIEQSGTSKNLPTYSHPEQAIYLLGAEDHGLVDEAKEAVDVEVEIPSDECLNICTAGSVVLYDRFLKQEIDFNPPPYLSEVNLEPMFAEDI